MESPTEPPASATNQGKRVLPVAPALWAQIPEVAHEPLLLIWDHMRALERENRALHALQRERSIAECPTCSDLCDENGTLSELVAQLRAEIERLKERLNQNSSNSSRPPSTDPPDCKRYAKRRKKSGLKPGGQPGHPGHQRRLVPEDQVELKHCYPKECGQCGHDLTDCCIDDEPFRHQVADLPEIRVKVVEYRLHTKRCSKCLELTRAEVPDGVPTGNFGPNVEGTVALLTGCYPLSRRNAVALLRDLFGLDMSLGVVPTIEKRMTNALEPAVTEAKESVKKSSSVNNDATGWRQNGNRRYMFISVTRDVVTFDITPQHNAEVVTQLLGPDFQGFLNSDRHSIYSGIPVEQRQVCLSHVDRDFAKMAARGGESKATGEQGMALMRKGFHEWHRFKAGELNRLELQKQFQPIEKAMETVLTAGVSCCQHEQKEPPCIHKKTERACKNLLDILPAFWTFVHHEGVEPTNNASEQGLRRAVIKRKLSFGAKSKAGNQYVESMMTVAATLARQGRHVLSFLVATLTAILTGGQAPSLMRPKESPQAAQPSLPAATRQPTTATKRLNEAPRSPPQAGDSKSRDPEVKAA